MGNYISKFTGTEIDESIQKAKDINKTANEINTNLNYVTETKNNVANIATGEVVSKKADGTLEGTGIINESDKIFFPKDGRFPSASVDIGPAITLSENGGWTQYTAHTLGRKYILLQYEVDETGTKNPVYWERVAQENNVIISADDTVLIENVQTLEYIPTTDSQVNAIRYNFANALTNFRMEIKSLVTGAVIKYIPDEKAWKNNSGGLTIVAGLNDILNYTKSSPVSFLQEYDLQINFKADTPVNLMGNGVSPYLDVDRQLIIRKNVLIEGDELGNPDNQCWVSPNGNDNNSGSLQSPFATVQKALNSLYACINIVPGTYTEDLTIPTAYGQYAPVIAGSGTFESPKTFIRGTMTIPAGVSRVRIKDLALDGKNIAPAIIDNGSDGRHILQDVTVYNPAQGGDLIRIVNGNNWWNVCGSSIEGNINLSGVGVNASFNISHSTNSFLCNAIVNSGYTFTAFYVAKMGLITHNAGLIVCSYVGTWYGTDGKIINSVSASPADLIAINYSAFTADGINFSTISTAGATLIKKYNVESL